MKLINYLFILLLTAFRLITRPLLGPACCKYAVGCTNYAVIQLKEHTLFKALWLIAKRILSCNPFIKSSY